MVRRRHFLLGALATAVVGTTRAQSFPDRPLKLIVPFAAGGGSDIVGRALAKELASELGQSVIVENRPGAAGLLGLDALGASTPDGHTLLLFSNTTAVALHFQNKTFDMEMRFVPVGNVITSSMILLVNPSTVNVRSVPELVEYVKAHPGAEYTSSGPGSPGNLGIEAMALQRGLRFTHVPYRGIGPAIVDVLAGRVGILVSDSLSARPHIVSGALRPIASASSFRSPVVPDVPTAIEQGVPQLVNDSLNGLVVPIGTPGLIVERLRTAARRAVAAEDYARLTAENGAKNQFIDGPEWGNMLKADFERWGEVIRVTGIKPA
jgi:tripartite-type tricarboxylate transporter receptor subunit TctC